MKLTKPRPTGTTSAAADDLMHEAAMRIQSRFDADEGKRRRAERVRTAKSVLAGLFFLVIAGGAFMAWQSGMLDAWIGGRTKPEPQNNLSDLFGPDGVAAPVESEPAPIEESAKPSLLGTVAKSVLGQKDEAVNLVDRNMSARTQAEKEFLGASVDYWKNAVAADKPGKTQRLAFTGLVPDGQGGHELLELRMGGGEPFAIQRLTAVRGAEEIDKAAFNKLIAQTPYLVVREGRAYFCSAGQAEQKTSFAVPADGKAFDPSREEFGALADCLDAVKAKRPAFRYQVSLVIEKFAKTLPVATVGYGESVPRSAFEQAAESLIADKDMVRTLLAAAKVKVEPTK